LQSPNYADAIGSAFQAQGCMAPSEMAVKLPFEALSLMA